VKIEYKDPVVIVYKNMKATEYPRFLAIYPEKALSMGLEISNIKVEKEFDSQEGDEIVKNRK